MLTIATKKTGAEVVISSSSRKLAPYHYYTKEDPQEA